MQLYDLFTESNLLQMKTSGYVREQTHPTYSFLRILNYTEKAQFDQVWNDVTLNCRGLIYDARDEKIVARGFKKFFNYDHKDTHKINLDDEVVVMDKMDGSLGILYRVPDTDIFAIATRGSFDSDQARHATKLLNEKYGEWLWNNQAAIDLVTALFEIVYPENRIVCNYGDMDDLVLLGAEVVTTGKTWDADEARYFFDWEGPVAEIFDFETFGEALAAKPREGAEGFVVLNCKTGERVKIKQEDYIALHRIVTGLNARTVWTHMKEGKPLTEMVENLPDEFHDWVKQVWQALEEDFAKLGFSILAEWHRVCKLALNEQPGSRKVFASHAKQSEFPAFMFLMLDNKLDRLKDKQFEMIKPSHEWNPNGRLITEDNT